MRGHVWEMFGDFLVFKLAVPAKELTACDPVASRDVGQLILEGQVVLDRPEVLPFLEHYQLQLSRIRICQLHLLHNERSVDDDGMVGVERQNLTDMDARCVQFRRVQC
jgi:hypothetical protein